MKDDLTLYFTIGFGILILMLSYVLFEAFTSTVRASYQKFRESERQRRIEERERMLKSREIK